MPRATLEILKGRTLDQKRALAKEITALLQEYLGKPEAAFNGFLRILESNPEDLGSNAELCADAFARGEGYVGKPEPRLTIQYLAGGMDSLDMRRTFVRRVTDVLVGILGVPEGNVLVLLLEIPKSRFASNGVMVA
ncbi:MAG: tautomerase family protein [Synergistaceae bacterium]|jgi:phenylpyruvate tautomerase PptA (4-oxalocrotonate tautomerase family)|nr:tautomerase family protein [Synergistaceae bacterium]